MTDRIRIGTLAALFALFSLVACSDDSTGPGDGDEHPPTVNEPGFEAEMSEGTVFMEEEMVEDALTEYDRESGRLSFDAAALDNGQVSLEPGDVILVAGVALRKVQSVSTSGGERVVETTFATLPEAFENAEIEWDEPMEFTADVIQNARLDFRGRSLAPTEIAANQASWSYEVGTYTIEATLTAAGSSAQLETTVAKTFEGSVQGAFTATTTFQSVQNTANITIEDHTTRSFDYQNTGLGGTVELSVAAAGAGQQDLLFETPEAVIRIPFTIGPMPATLGIKAGMITGITVVGNASAQASTSFTWGGDAGFQYNGSEVTATAGNGLGSPTVGASNGDAAAGIGNEVEIQWGLAAPVLELGLFGETVVPFIRPEFYLRTYLEWGPVCKSLQVDYQVTGGLNLQLLGVQLGEGYQETMAGPYVLSEEGDSCPAGSGISGSGITGPAAPHPFAPIEFGWPAEGEPFHPRQ